MRIELLIISYMSSLHTNDTMLQFWLKLLQWFCRRFLISSFFFAIHYNLPLEKAVPLYLNKPEISSSKNDLCQAWLKLAKRFKWRRLIKLRKSIFTISLFCPLGRGRGPSFEHIWSSFTQECLYLVWMKLAKWFWSEFSRYFVIISPLKKGCFIWTNLNPFYPRMLCTIFGWDWPSDSAAENLWIFFIYFNYFAIISPFKKGTALHLNKL